MNEFKEFYDKLYGLAYIVRYPGIPKIKEESVAEHSFFVASFVIKLHEYYDFDLGSALQMAITHDWAESFIGDVSWVVKKADKAIGEAIDVAEDRAMFNNFSEQVYNNWAVFADQKAVEAKIVLLADILQVMQYAEHETELGNRNMISVVNVAETRMYEVLEELNEHKL